MLHAKDLMVGDYLRINRDGLCIKKGTIVEVRGIDADDKLIEAGLIGSTHYHPLDKELFDGGIRCDYLDPIPLTPEILKKNGWKEYASSEDFHGYNCVFIKQKGGYYGACVDYKRTVSGPLKYVHELQHTLRLCKIEKEIEL